MEKLPLSEKYRPKKLNEIIGNKDELFFFKKYIDTNYIPNIIINGFPGTGKTSCALAFVNEYFKNIDCKDKDFLELNASDDRGIDIVRSKINVFAKKKNNKENNIDNSKNSNFSIILLDEADNMTQSAQYALKRTIDKYNYKTRFILTCNNIENIIDNIQSMCTIFEFGNISTEEIFKKLKTICVNEQINIKDNAINALINLHENKNDIRGMINMIELIKGNFFNSSLNKPIDKNNIYEICDKPSPEYIYSIFSNIENKKIINAINISYTLKSIGFTNLDICSTLYNEILNYNFKSNNDNIKLKCYDCTGDFNIIYINGNDSDLQLASLIISLSKIINN